MSTTMNDSYTHKPSHMQPQTSESISKALENNPLDRLLKFTAPLESSKNLSFLNSCSSTSTLYESYSQKLESIKGFNSLMRLDIEASVEGLINSALRSYVNEAAERIHIVSKQTKIPLSKIIIRLSSDSGSLDSKKLEMIACFNTTKDSAEFLWENFSTTIDAWVASKTSSEIETIFNNMMVTFIWER